MPENRSEWIFSSQLITSDDNEHHTTNSDFGRLSGAARRNRIMVTLVALQPLAECCCWRRSLAGWRRLSCEYAYYVFVCVCVRARACVVRKACVVFVRLVVAMRLCACACVTRRRAFAQAAECMCTSVLLSRRTAAFDSCCCCWRRFSCGTTSSAAELFKRRQYLLAAAAAATVVLTDSHFEQPPNRVLFDF